MSKLILTLAVAAAIGLPSIVGAETPPITGSIVCRPIRAGETANATIQNTQLLCHSLNMDKIRTAMTAAMSGVSDDEKAKIEAAMAVLRDELQLEPRYPGYDGNPSD